MSALLPSSVTYLITNGQATAANFGTTRKEILDSISGAAADGVALVQIREKALTARLLFELAREAAERLAGADTRLLINERVDIALAAGAHGVHLPSNSVPADVVRRFAPAGFLIGVSTHGIDELERARSSGADFAVFGPVYETPGKGPGVGLVELSKAAGSVSPFPVLAVGGIDATNAVAALRAGAAGIAAIRALVDPQRRAEIISAIAKM